MNWRSEVAWFRQLAWLPFCGTLVLLLAAAVILSGWAIVGTYLVRYLKGGIN